MTRPPFAACETMNSVTIAIPSRWKNVSGKIVQFLEDEARLGTATITHFKVNLVPPADEGQIYAFASSLNASQAIFCDSAITALNTALNVTSAGDWRTTKQIADQAHRDVDEIESIRAACDGS